MSTVPRIDDERLARAAFARVSEPGDAHVHALVARFGVLHAWELLRTERVPLPEPRVEAMLVRARAARPEEDVAVAARGGGRFLCPGDPEWPPALDELGPAAPLCLWVRGSVSLAAAMARSVAVVGARAASDYGLFMGGELGAGLVAAGWTVVSGGAYGVDAAAHRGALAAGGPTVTVLACGINVVYPRGHDTLFAQVAEHGALATEWPPGCAPHRNRFLVRNRVIATAAATVVVEAALRSGAMSTAAHAARLGRPVLAVPGAATAAMSAGCHALIREGGATLVTETAHVLEAVGPLRAPGEPPPAPARTARDGLDPLTKRVLDAVPVARGAAAAEIAVTAGVDQAGVLAALGTLELHGLVTRRDGLFRIVARAPA